MATATKVYTATNAEDGVECLVWERQDGKYFVCMRDTDADMQLPWGMVYVEKERAIDKANFWANID